jgi:histidinol-phosphate/aromatic aminotransferase/cobyric acid decarboxylase-like protein
VTRLAVASYEPCAVLSDEANLLNLTWTLDERTFLDVDLSRIAADELRAELDEGLPFLGSYFVRDPFGADLLTPAVRAHFSQPAGEWRVTCAAGVNALLQSAASFAEGGTAYVVGDLYPDFVHWTERAGGRCVSCRALPHGHDHVANARAAGASVVVLERPSLTADGVDLEALRTLCQGVATGGAVVVVDESYANYYPPSFSAVPLVSELPNLVVLRGLSKAYSLGSLRLGVAVAAPALSERLRASTAPMLVSSLALRLGRRVLSLGDVTRRLRDRIGSAKYALRRHLQTAGLEETADTAAYVPYFFLRNDAATRRRLDAVGVRGKVHWFWDEQTMAERSEYRLSVPLDLGRAEAFARRLGGPSDGAANRGIDAPRSRRRTGAKMDELPTSNEWERLAATAERREIMAKDLYFRESWAEAAEVFGERTAAVFTSIAMLSLKPDAVVGRRMRPIVEYLVGNGFRPVAVGRTRLNRHSMRELWRYDWDIFPVDRLAFSSWWYTVADILVLLLEDTRPEPGLSATVRLAAMKGGPVAAKRKPTDLRSALRPPNRILNFVHVADEAGDVVRELGIFFDRDERLPLLHRIASGTGTDQREAVLEAIRRLEAENPEHDLDVGNALARVGQATAATPAAIDRIRHAVAQGETLPWDYFCSLLDPRGPYTDRWDFVCIASHVVRCEREPA